MIVHLCDRCQTSALLLGAKTLVVPVTDPAGDLKAVTQDVSVNVTLVTDLDLCRVCWLATVFELAATALPPKMAANLKPKLMATLGNL